MSGPRYGRAPTTLWRRVGKEVLLAAPDGDDVDRLSRPAAAAWLLLEPPRTGEGLTDDLARELGVKAEDIEGRVVLLLRELEDRRWVVRAPDA